MANIGERIAKQYILEKEIENAPAQTFLARDSSNNNQVLARVFKATQSMSQGQMNTFHRLAALKSVNLEKPIAVGELPPAEYFMIVDAPDGMSLRQLIPKNEGLTLTELWPLFHQIAQALQIAHQQDVKHFDLSPENITITYDDEDNEVVHLRWQGPNSDQDDVLAMRKLVAFMLHGREPSAQEISDVAPLETYSSVQHFEEALSEIHRKQITVVSERQEALSENVVDSSLGRFMVVSVVITLVGCTLLLYYWLTSSS